MTRATSRLYRILPLLALTVLFSGCELIGDIFEAGFWLGVIIVLIIIALVVWLIRKIGAGRRGPPPPA